ncbi:MAG: hypothetical protein ABEH77_10095 [Halobacteriaceae archaeon]
MSGPAAVVDDLARSVDADLRVAVEYHADEYDVLFVRDDVAAAYTDEEFDEHLKEFVMKGYDDAPRQPEFTRFGVLEATIRWFHDIVAVHVPLGEWDGYLFTFERDSFDDGGGFTGAVLGFVDDRLRDADEDIDDRIDDHFG